MKDIYNKDEKRVRIEEEKRIRAEERADRKSRKAEDNRRKAERKAEDYKRRSEKKAEDMRRKAEERQNKVEKKSAKVALAQNGSFFTRLMYKIFVSNIGCKLFAIFFGIVIWVLMIGL